MKPFVALGSPAQTLVIGSAGFRPLGVVIGGSVVGNVATNVSGLDGKEIRYRAESFELALGNARRSSRRRSARAESWGYGSRRGISGIRTVLTRWSRSVASGPPFSGRLRPKSHFSQASTAPASPLAMGRLQVDAREAGGEGVVGVDFRPEIVERGHGMRIDIVVVGAAVRRELGHGASDPPRTVVPLR